MGGLPCGSSSPVWTSQKRAITDRNHGRKVIAKKPTNERTSKSIASIVSRGLKNPETLTNAEIKKIAATALTQAPNKSKPK
jgi:hypothetical protein